MPGTVKGGKAAARTNKEKWGEDFYARIALQSQEAWVRNGRKPRGFAANKKLASIAGAKGGAKSRRGKTKTAITIPVTDSPIITPRSGGLDYLNGVTA